MLAVISNNQPTPLSNATPASHRLIRARGRSKAVSRPNSKGLKIQAPNSINTTVKCRKRHSTIALVMNYWPTLKL
ncbi:hypothetical protein D3C87_2033240 [compost metagenome]